MKTMEVYWVRFQFRLWQVLCFLVFLPFGLCFWLVLELPKIFTEFLLDEWQRAYSLVYQNWLIPKYRSKKAKEIVTDYGNLSTDEFCIKHKCSLSDREKLFSLSQKELNVGDK